MLSVCKHVNWEIQSCSMLLILWPWDSCCLKHYINNWKGENKMLGVIWAVWGILTFYIAPTGRDFLLIACFHVQCVFPACGKVSPVHGAELCCVHCLKLHCGRNDGSQSLMTLRAAQRVLLLSPFFEVWKSAWRFGGLRQWVYCLGLVFFFHQSFPGPWWVQLSNWGRLEESVRFPVTSWWLSCCSLWLDLQIWCAGRMKIIWLRGTLRLLHGWL